MISGRRIHNGLVLATMTLLFMAVLVALVLLVASVPSVVLFGLGLAVIAGAALYLAVLRGRAGDSGDILWRY